jgi:UDP-N-acetylmuramate dehydrogenase
MQSLENPALKKVLKNLGAQDLVPLAPLCTFKAGGPARFFIKAERPEDVMTLQMACEEYGVSLHILSGGSNTLFSDQVFPGVVLKLGSAFDEISVKSDGLSMEVKAATPFAKVTKKALAMGWGKALGWSGTPGLIGGALRMNAGTRLGEIKDALLRVHGIKNGKLVVFEREDIEFSYRENSLPNDLLIIKADLAYDISLIEDIKKLEVMAKEYRIMRRASQPNTASAGSFFKNPYPRTAAQLIENCDIKGLQYGGAQISKLHANFIVNNGGATANDIIHLASIAQDRVFDRFGIRLAPEIRLIGPNDLSKARN